LADELRDADSEPCAVCDAMPHRSWLVGSSVQRQESRVVAAAMTAMSGTQTKRGWLAHWLTSLHPSYS
jgi:hypothetical protein